MMLRLNGVEGSNERMNALGERLQYLFLILVLAVLVICSSEMPE
jgi:hypothetical protein